jgi:O-antigen/teichoic acid export membrane protein
MSTSMSTSLGMNAKAESNLTAGAMAAPAEGGARALRKRFVGCALSTTANLAGSQVLRLAGNLILTRLLYPEAFGMMALVNVFLMGLAMFSDIGLGPGIVHRANTPSRALLQTAWTMQVLRAGILFVLTCLLAWPLAWFYREPGLAVLLVATGLTQLVAGFKSVALHLCARELKHGLLAAVDLSTAAVGIAVSVAWALRAPSVWALVWGGLISAIFAVAASFRLPHQVDPKFRLAPGHVRELLRFGGWIFVGTALAFLASCGDRLMLGRFLTLEQLGVYTVAFFFAQSVTTVTRGLAARVLFPVLSKLRGADPEVRNREWVRYRRILLGVTFAAVAGLMAGSGLLISVLYDERYSDAAGMLRVLALGAAGASWSGLADPVLMAGGDSFRRMWLSFWEAAFLLACMGLGGAWFGMPGYIGGYVLSQFLSCLPAAWLTRKHQIGTPGTDAAFFGATALLALLWFLTSAPSPVS